MFGFFSTPKKGYSYASVWQGGGETGLSHGHCSAISDDEARGIAIKKGQNAFPDKHMLIIQVLEITPNG